MLDINVLIQIRTNAKQCWNRFNIEKNRKMKLFACCNQILLRNVLRDCICVLCRACNFDHARRIFNSNGRRILIGRYLVFSFILSASSSIDSCLLIFVMHRILCLLLLHQLNSCLLLFKGFQWFLVVRKIVLNIKCLSLIFFSKSFSVWQDNRIKTLNLYT